MAELTHTLVQLTPADLLRDSENINGWLQSIADYSGGEFTVEMLINETQKGLMMLYYRELATEKNRGLVCARPVAYHHGPTLVVVGAAGDADDNWGGLTHLFNELAKVFDCTSFEIKGRRDHLRAMESHGWKEKHTIICHDVYERGNVVPLDSAAEET